jgi:flagellar protein FlaF
MSLNAYRSAISRAEHPRATEHRLLGQITGEMMAAKSAGHSGAALMPALHRNREVWTAFASDCGARGNGLPDGLRAGIISLALWVERYTSQVIAGRESIDELIDLNRTLMEGLAGEAMAA